MLDRKQIAAMLGVPVDTVRRKVETRPDFPKPALRLSRKTVRWEPGDILRWIARQKSAQA
jgi:predicted DNA-binding transcriptional regulator AlpA